MPGWGGDESGGAGLFDEGRKEVFAVLMKNIPRIKSELAVIRERTVARQGYDSFKESLVQERGMDDVSVLVGGIIPDADVDALKAIGIAGIFPPGSPMEDIVDFIRRAVKPRVGTV